MLDTAGSAAAPAARCRKFRRGSFILNLPSRHSISSSARGQRRRNLQPDRLGGLEIDDELEFRRHLHRKVSRLFAAKDAIDVLCRLAQSVLEVVTVADEPAGLDGCGGCEVRG